MRLWLWLFVVIPWNFAVAGVPKDFIAIAPPGPSETCPEAVSETSTPTAWEQWSLALYRRSGQFETLDGLLPLLEAWAESPTLTARSLHLGISAVGKLAFHRGLWNSQPEVGRLIALASTVETRVGRVQATPRTQRYREMTQSLAARIRKGCEIHGEGAAEAGNVFVLLLRQDGQAARLPVLKSKEERALAERIRKYAERDRRFTETALPLLRRAITSDREIDRLVDELVRPDRLPLFSERIAQLRLELKRGLFSPVYAKELDSLGVIKPAFLTGSSAPPGDSEGSGDPGGP